MALFIVCAVNSSGGMMSIVITIQARAHRILRRRSRRDGTGWGMSRYHDVRDEPELVGAFDAPGEDLVGFYENDEDVDPRVIVVTSRGLRFPATWAVPPLDFDEIVTVGMPPDKAKGPFELSIQRISGDRLILPISGVHEKGKDVYGFGRFLLRVVGDLKARERA